MFALLSLGIRTVEDLAAIDSNLCTECVSVGALQALVSLILSAYPFMQLGDPEVRKLRAFVQACAPPLCRSCAASRCCGLVLQVQLQLQ